MKYHPERKYGRECQRIKNHTDPTEHVDDSCSVFGSISCTTGHLVNGNLENEQLLCRKSRMKIVHCCQLLIMALPSLVCIFHLFWPLASSASTATLQVVRLKNVDSAHDVTGSRATHRCNLSGKYSF